MVTSSARRVAHAPQYNRADAYVLVKSIAVPDAEPLEIYRSCDIPFHQSARRKE